MCQSLTCLFLNVSKKELRETGGAQRVFADGDMSKTTEIILATVTGPLTSQQSIFKVMGGQKGRNVAPCSMQHDCYSTIPFSPCVYSKNYSWNTNMDLNVYGNDFSLTYSPRRTKKEDLFLLTFVKKRLLFISIQNA